MHVSNDAIICYGEALGEYCWHNVCCFWVKPLVWLSGKSSEQTANDRWMACVWSSCCVKTLHILDCLESVRNCSYALIQSYEQHYILHILYTINKYIKTIENMHVHNIFWTLDRLLPCSTEPTSFSIIIPTAFTLYCITIWDCNYVSQKTAKF